LLLTVIKYLFWRCSLLLLKLSLGSTENTMMEPETKAAIVPPNCRVRRGGAVNFDPEDGGDMFLRNVS
jgi:hypothetical protein